MTTQTQTTIPLAVDVITNVSERLYLNEALNPFAEDLLVAEDEKLVDGVLHITHIDGALRPLSVQALTRLYLNLRTSMLLDDDDAPETPAAPAPTPQPPKDGYATVAQYARARGMNLVEEAIDDISRHALTLANESGVIVQSYQGLFKEGPAFPQDLLARAFSTFFVWG